MKLLPRVVKKSLLLSFGFEVERSKDIKQQVEAGRKEVQAEVWEKVGLCIHAYDDGHELHRWRVTHVESGRAVLRGLKSREQAIDYLMKARKTLLDWTFTQDQFTHIDGVERARITYELKVLQQKIKKENDGERKLQKRKRQSYR